MASPAKAADSRDDLVQIDGPEVQCRVIPALASALEALLPAGDPETWPGFEEVKASVVRRVLRGTMHATEGAVFDVHLKLYRTGQLSDRARDALRGPRSAREFDNLREARAKGLPCVEPLAAGVMRGSGGSRSFLITRTEAGVSLHRGALSAVQMHRVGELLRLAHDRGLHARDLHAGNLLEREDGSLVLLDLTSAVVATPLELDQRAHALAFFCRDLDGNVLDPAARPLIEAYAASPACVQAAARAGARLRNRGLSAFGRRALRPCRHTAVEQRKKAPSWYLHRPTAEWHEAARALIETPPPPVKSGRRGAVHLGDQLVLKDRTAAAACRLFRAAYWLAFAGVPCPKPVALRTYLRRGQVVSTRLAGPSLRDELAAGLGDPGLLAAARQLGRAVGRLHAHGLRNRDMKLENLVRDPVTGEVAMVDLDGIHRKIARDRRGQGADLGRLLASFRESGEPGGARVLRAFWRAYIKARTCLLQPPTTRPLLRLTQERAASWETAHAPPRVSAPSCATPAAESWPGSSQA